MPHRLDVDCGLVLRLALLLEVQGGKKVNRLVNSSLEQNVVGLEGLVALLDLLDSIEGNSDRPWDMFAVVGVFIGPHQLFSVVFSGGRVGLFNQFQLGSQIPEHLRQLLLVELFMLDLPKSRINEDDSVESFRFGKVHLENHCSTKALAYQKDHRFFFHLFQEMVNKGQSLFH